MISYGLRLLRLQAGTLLATLSFFSLALFCFSLALGSEEKALQRSVPALLWILTILTTLFSTPLLLRLEAQQGLLDEVILQPSPPAFYLLSKVGAEFLLLGLPLIVLGALFSSFFSLSPFETLTLSLSLMIGFPALSALGSLGGLLTLHTRGGGILIALLILPLTLPLLLLALSGVEMARLGLDSFASFCLLTGVSLLLLMISVGAGGWALVLAGEG